MLTVMMATYNGASTFPLVLEAYLGLEAPRRPQRRQANEPAIRGS
jgi:hypothetical protein